MATPVTWPEIVPTDSVDKTGATATVALLEVLAALLVTWNPLTRSSTTSCKSWVLVAPLLEVPPLLASKLVDMAMTVELPSPGNVDPQEVLLPGSKAVVVVATATVAAQADLHLGLLEVLEAAQTTTMEDTAVAILRAAQLHGSRAMQRLKLDTEAVMVATAMVGLQATIKVTVRQQHPAWHHGNSRATEWQEVPHHPHLLVMLLPLLLLLRTHHLLHHQALEWTGQMKTEIAALCS